MPEKLAFDQFGRQRGTVNFDQRQASAPTPGVYGPGDQFLAGSGLPGNQHGRIGARDLVDIMHQPGLRIAVADDGIETDLFLDFLPQVAVFLLQAVTQLPDFLERNLQGILHFPFFGRIEGVDIDVIAIGDGHKGDGKHPVLTFKIVDDGRPVFDSAIEHTQRFAFYEFTGALTPAIQQYLAGIVTVEHHSLFRQAHDRVGVFFWKFVRRLWEFVPPFQGLLPPQ